MSATRESFEADMGHLLAVRLSADALLASVVMSDATEEMRDRAVRARSATADAIKAVRDLYAVLGIRAT